MPAKTMPAAPTTKKSARQPKRREIQKSSGPKQARPRYSPTVYTAVAWARSCSRNQVATTRLLVGKAWRLADAEAEAKREQRSDAVGETLHQREERPESDREEIGEARADAVQEPSAGDLRRGIAPRERGEDDAHHRGGNVQFGSHVRSGDAKHRAVQVVDHGADRDQGEDAEASAGLHRGTRR